MCAPVVGGGDEIRKVQRCGEHVNTSVLLSSAKTDAVPWTQSGYSKPQGRLLLPSFPSERRLRTPGYSWVTHTA